MRKFLLFTFLLSILVELTGNAQAKGHLVIIGGGKRSINIMQKIVELAGGKDARIIVIPNASSVPIETAKYQVKEFAELGVASEYLVFSAETVDADSNINKLKTATGIFFSGGDQSNLTKVLLGTKLLEKIYEIYNDGGVISGTSAGAAVMSKIMITGNEIMNKDSNNAFISIQKNNYEVKEGFGFINSAIVDQHFIKRKRMNRLISLVFENPNLLGIGIDESTAIIVNPDDTFEVIGESLVMVLDASQNKKIEPNRNGYLSGSMGTHFLKEGDKFNLITKRIIQ